MATIKGKWRWNDVVHCRFNFTNWVNFTSNEEAYIGIKCEWSVGYHHFRYVDEEYDEIEVGTSANEGDDFFSVSNEYRIMDFGESEQKIDDELYDFIVANAREWNISDKLEIIAENELKVFDAGKKAEYDAFWDRYQNNGERYNYQYGAFGGIGWNDETFKPKYPLKPVHCYQMFQGCYITEIKDVDFSGTKGFNNVFAYSYIEKIGLIEIPLATSMDNTFNGSAKLHTIEKIVINSNSTFRNTFQNCSALENITFEGEIGNDINFQWSTLLTKASITNIINHLSDTAIEKTLTLSKAAVDKAFETSEGANDGETSQEWDSLVGFKMDWNISLV